MWVGLAFDVHFSGDTNVPCLVAECVWAWFWCALSWWHRLACLVPGCKLACFFDVNSSGDTDCGLSCFRRWVVPSYALFWWHRHGLSCFREWVGLVFNMQLPGTHGLSCFRGWVGLVSNVHSADDTDVMSFVSEGELVKFLICALLVTETVACLLSVGELALFLMCTLLVSQVACLVSGSELALCLMSSLLVTQMWLVLFQEVSWPGF